MPRAQAVLNPTKQMRRFQSVDGRSVLFASLLTTALLTGIKTLSILQPLELFIFDRLTALRPDQANDPRLLIVGMTENDIQQYGWPLSDQQLADILKQLQQHHPRVIGLDLYRSNLQQGLNQCALLEQLAADNLITIMNVGNDSDIGDVPPPPTVPNNRIGFSDLVIDSDGIVRRSLLFAKHSNQEHYSFGLRVVLAALAKQSQSFQYDDDTFSIGNTTFTALQKSSGGYGTLDSRGYQILLHYRSRQMPAKHVTVSQVLSGKVSAELIQDKIVLIGTTAPSLKDQFFTPFSAGQVTEFTMSGVIMHAQIISQLLDAVEGQPVLYRFLPQWSESLWLMVWAAIAATITWKLNHPGWYFFTISLCLVTLIGSATIGLVFLVWLPTAEPMMGSILAGGLVIMQKLLYRSTHDQLTNLPNRELFTHLIQQSLRSRRNGRNSPPVVVAFLDLDRFKLINQSRGHGVGDQVLLTIATRLQQVLPQSAQLARVGGDEFAFLFQAQAQADVKKLVDVVQAAVTEPICIGGQQLSITASIGLAISHSDYDYQSEDLLRDSHTAMYRAKSLGQSRYQVFASGMLTEAVNQFELECDLAKALTNKEFMLYYQPILRLDNNQVIGFEALVRWHHPERGFVLPSAFIPMAEDIELIWPLGQWVFETACCQLKNWQQRFPQHSLKMSINLSRQQLNHTNLVQQVKDGLVQSGINSRLITLEVTESMMMRDEQTARVIMLQLKDLGLRLSIDDFGTGYSSLSQLHHFPMDALKIDRSFISRMEQSDNDRAIVKTIIALGQEMGMEIVAEGIEAPTQLDYLNQLGCQYGQGYLFSEPLSAEDATDWLTRQYSSTD